MNRKLLPGFAIILFLFSCASINNRFIIKHKKKSISLAGISDQVKIGYETEQAIIYIGRQDAISLTENLLKNKNQRLDRVTLNDLRTNLDTLKLMQQGFIVQHWMTKQGNLTLHDINFAGFIDQWILKSMVLEGKVEVLNKSSNEYEKRVTYHFIRDKLGGEQCYYTFDNGKEFHSQIIALGE